MIIDAQHHYRVDGTIPSDLSSRLKWMDESGIDLAVLTNPLQGVTDMSERNEKYSLSTTREWNDELASVERDHPDRFVACPSIPIFDSMSAVEELERVVSKNEARAVFVQPFRWRIDYDYLSRLYEKLNDLKLPIFFHPVHVDLPVPEMGSVVGFPFNTTVAVSKFITSGLLDSYPNLKLVIPHAGGGLPIVLGRLEVKYKAGKLRSSHSPSQYFDNFYFDAVCYSQKAFEFAISILGPQRFVFGSDFGCPGKEMVQPRLFKSFIEGLPISYDQRQNILGRTLANLLKMKVLAREA